MPTIHFRNGDQKPITNEKVDAILKALASQSMTVAQKKWYSTIHHIQPDPVFGKGYESFKEMGRKLKGYPQKPK